MAKDDTIKCSELKALDADVEEYLEDLLKAVNHQKWWKDKKQTDIPVIII